MKSVKYMLSIIASVLIIFVPIAFIILAVINNSFVPFGIIAIIALIASVLLYKPIATFRVTARQEVEMDEFGNSKAKQYERLSKKERDAIDLQKTADMERIVGSATLKKLTHKGSEDPQKDLDNLIGLTELKQQVREMAAKMEFDAQEAKLNKGKKIETDSKTESGHHAVYFGSPGTGKTTLARIMTGFLYKYHYINENKCVEVDGNFLKAGPDTATKTTYVIQKSFGGVLFVDEAYALMQGDMYGLDAIATLIKQMEDNRGRFVLILAGYTNEMKQLLDTNPGFKSRIKDYLLFPDYSDEEMLEIFEMMAKQKGYEIDNGAKLKFKRRVANERPLDSYGNARTARSILDEAMEKHAYNFITNKWDESYRHTIREEDIKEFPKII